MVYRITEDFRNFLETVEDDRAYFLGELAILLRGRFLFSLGRMVSPEFLLGRGGGSVVVVGLPSNDLLEDFSEKAVYDYSKIVEAEGFAEAVLSDFSNGEWLESWEGFITGWINGGRSVDPLGRNLGRFEEFFI